MRNKEQLLTILLLVFLNIFLIGILYLFPRREFSYKSKFQFQYFKKINKEKLNIFFIDVPIITELRSNKKVLNDLKTFIIFDSKIKENIKSIRIKISGKNIDKKVLLKQNCSLYDGTCLVLVSNDLIKEQIIRIELQDDLYILNGRKPTFIGLYFQVAD